jgi:hypothetical protein
MGDDNANEASARPRGDKDRKAGNSGEGSDSVLRLIRSRRLAQFRETASDPDEQRRAEREDDDPR